jgi:lipoprotein LpqB-like beta-propeller protein/sporulation and spore germination protein
VGSRARRPVLALLAAVTAALAVTGCVSMPSAGPVLSYPVTQQAGSQNGQNLQFTTQPPGSGWTPQQIVSGFLIAAAANQDQVAREYLTPPARRTWDPPLTTYVYTSRPNVLNPVPQATVSQQAGPSGKSGKKARKPSPPPTATVEVNGKIQAILSEKEGTYVPSASGSSSSGSEYFTLQQTDGEWRISTAPAALLLTQAQFADDYDLRNLYFFDPNYHYLVPDPVYVPLQASASTLTSRLVGYLKSPPEDWLAEGATQTAFPPGAKVTAVLAGNLATVNITGTIGKAQRAEVVSQLLWTLVGSGQGGSQVESVQLNVNGKPFYPSGSPVNPVQNLSQASYGPATGASASATGQLVYYLGGAGEVYSNHVGVAGVAGQQTRVAKIGVGYKQIAVSKDGKYLAALRDGGELYMGPIGGPLLRQQGSGYMTLSWDPTDNLWATTGANEQIFVFRAGVSPNSRLARPIEATVTSGNYIVSGDQYSALQIAPDGVRVAMILNADELTFGAIVWQPGTGTGPGGVRIQLSPFNVGDLDSTFDQVTWYGADNVITLGGPAYTLTEYPVNGGTPTSQTLNQTVESITASPGQALIAGVAKDEIIEASNLTGAWATIATVDGTPVKGISPTYPG